MDYNLLLRLLCAHLLCDFVLQSTKLVKQKGSKDTSTRLKANLWHALVHAAAAYVVVGIWEAWYIPVAILVSHFAIDFLYRKDKKGLNSFLIDQLLHLSVIVALWLFASEQYGSVSGHIENLLAQNKIWAILIAYLLMLKPASIVISIFIDKWSDQLKSQQISIQGKGLEDAGRWIGYIERFLIVTFIFTNSLVGIGFLLAAKSIFRYGDLKDLNDIKMTEYVLIGTLASFSIAIATGVFFKYVI